MLDKVFNKKNELKNIYVIDHCSPISSRLIDLHKLIRAYKVCSKFQLAFDLPFDFVFAFLFRFHLRFGLHTDLKS